MFADSPALNGIFIFIIGIIVVFLGISIIILFVLLAGKIFNRQPKADKVEKTEKIEKVKEAVVDVDDENIPEEIKVAIIAAITSYYFTNQKSKCDFVVKKIKRI